jgi:hypothetical protein
VLEVCFWCLILVLFVSGKRSNCVHTSDVIILCPDRNVGIHSTAVPQ